MHPVGQPPETFPLQGRYEGQPGQPAVTTVVQHTTVNMPAELPSDYVVWSLCNLLYGNPFCLGLAALIFSFKARDRKVAGDLGGARSYASTARCLNIWATVLVSLTILISIVSVIVVVVLANNAYNYSYNRYNSYNYNSRYYH